MAATSGWGPARGLLFGRWSIWTAPHPTGPSRSDFDASTLQPRSSIGLAPTIAWCVLAFAVLFAWHLYHGMRGEHWRRPPLAHGDGPDYESIAYSLSRGEGFQFAWQSHEWQRPYREDQDSGMYTQLARRDLPGPTASRPPLYPMAIAAIYAWVPRGGGAFAAVRTLSILCTSLAGALAVALAFQVARGIGLPESIASAAAVTALALAMLDRTIRTYSVDFLTEPMAMLWCTCIAISGLQWQRSGGTRRWRMFLGWSTAGLILTRSIAIFWLPGLAVLVAMSVPQRRWRHAGAFVILVLLLLSPWWIRNCIVLERWMPLGGQGQASLCGGYCDEAWGDWGNWHGDVERRLQQELDSVPGADRWTQGEREVALSVLARHETRSWIEGHAAQIPQLMAMRIMSHWSPFTGSSLAWRLAILAGWIALVAMRRREIVWLIGLPLISTATVAILYETGGRFLVPLYAILYMTAGIGVAGLLELARRISIALRRV